MSVGKETVFVRNIDYMAKFIIAGNAKRLTEGVFNKYFRGLMVNKVRK